MVEDLSAQEDPPADPTETHITVGTQKHFLSWSSCSVSGRVWLQNGFFIINSEGSISNFNNFKS